MLFSNKIIKIEVLDKNGTVVVTSEKGFVFPKNLDSDEDSILIIKGKNLTEFERNERVFVVVSTKAGDRIRYNGCVTMSMDVQLNIKVFTLDDTKDRTAITIHTSGGLELKLEDETQTVTLCAVEKETPVFQLDVKNDTIKLSAGKELTLSCGGASITFDSEGNITVKAKGTLDMSGKEIKASATQKAAVKGQSIEVSAAQSAKVEGKGKLDLTSSGVTQVKGSMIKLN